MAKPAQNTTSYGRAAQAVLDLINSKPSSPTRGEIIATLTGLQLIGPPAPGRFAPTKLGLEAIRTVIEKVRASYAKMDAEGRVTNAEYARLGRVEDVCFTVYDRAVDDVLDAAAAAPWKHLADLAVVVRTETCVGCEPNEQHKAAVALIVERVLGGFDAPTQDDAAARLSAVPLAEAA
jgi:hypothetical protein